MPTWAYRDKKGKVERVLVASNRLLRGQPRPVRHQSEQVLKTFYELECEQGSRLNTGEWTKSQIKNIHDTAIARFEQLGQEY